MAIAIFKTDKNPCRYSYPKLMQDATGSVYLITRYHKKARFYEGTVLRTNDPNTKSVGFSSSCFSSLFDFHGSLELSNVVED